MIFKIYFNQVNQQMYEINAKTKEEAIRKAQNHWNIVYKDPVPSYIEEKEGG